MEMYKHTNSYFFIAYTLFIIFSMQDCVIRNSGAFKAVIRFVSYCQANSYDIYNTHYADVFRVFLFKSIGEIFRQIILLTILWLKYDRL